MTTQQDNESVLNEPLNLTKDSLSNEPLNLTENSVSSTETSKSEKNINNLVKRENAFGNLINDLKIVFYSQYIEISERQIEERLLLSSERGEIIEEEEVERMKQKVEKMSDGDKKKFITSYFPDFKPEEYQDKESLTSLYSEIASRDKIIRLYYKENIQEIDVKRFIRKLLKELNISIKYSEIIDKDPENFELSNEKLESDFDFIYYVIQNKLPLRDIIQKIYTFQKGKNVGLSVTELKDDKQIIEFLSSYINQNDSFQKYKEQFLLLQNTVSEARPVNNFVYFLKEAIYTKYNYKEIADIYLEIAKKINPDINTIEDLKSCINTMQSFVETNSDLVENLVSKLSDKLFFINTNLLFQQKFTLKTFLNYCETAINSSLQKENIIEKIREYDNIKNINFKDSKTDISKVSGSVVIDEYDIYYQPLLEKVFYITQMIFQKFRKLTALDFLGIDFTKILENLSSQFIYESGDNIGYIKQLQDEFKKINESDINLNLLIKNYTKLRNFVYKNFLKSMDEKRFINLKKRIEETDAKIVDFDNRIAKIEEKIAEKIKEKIEEKIDEEQNLVSQELQKEIDEEQNLLSQELQKEIDEQYKSYTKLINVFSLTNYIDNLKSLYPDYPFDNTEETYTQQLNFLVYIFKNVINDFKDYIYNAVLKTINILYKKDINKDEKKNLQNFNVFIQYATKYILETPDHKIKQIFNWLNLPYSQIFIVLKKVRTHFVLSDIAKTLYIEQNKDKLTEFVSIAHIDSYLNLKKEIKDTNLSYLKQLKEAETMKNELKEAETMKQKIGKMSDGEKKKFITFYFPDFKPEEYQDETKLTFLYSQLASKDKQRRAEKIKQKVEKMSDGEKKKFITSYFPDFKPEEYQDKESLTSLYSKIASKDRLVEQMSQERQFLVDEIIAKIKTMSNEEKQKFIGFYNIEDTKDLKLEDVASAIVSLERKQKYSGEQTKTQPTKTTQLVKPIQPTKTTQTTQLVKQIQPTKTTQTTQLVKQIQPTQTTQLVKQIQPTQTTQLVKQIQPTKTTQTTQTTQLVKPIQQATDTRQKPLSLQAQLQAQLQDLIEKSKEITIEQSKFQKNIKIQLKKILVGVLDPDINKVKYLYEILEEETKKILNIKPDEKEENISEIVKNFCENLINNMRSIFEKENSVENNINSFRINLKEELTNISVKYKEKQISEIDILKFFEKLKQDISLQIPQNKNPDFIKKMETFYNISTEKEWLNSTSKNAELSRFNEEYKHKFTGKFECGKMFDLCKEKDKICFVNESGESLCDSIKKNDFTSEIIYNKKFDPVQFNIDDRKFISTRKGIDILKTKLSGEGYIDKAINSVKNAKEYEIIYNMSIMSLVRTVIPDGLFDSRIKNFYYAPEILLTIPRSELNPELEPEKESFFQQWRRLFQLQNQILFLNIYEPALSGKTFNTLNENLSKDLSNGLLNIKKIINFDYISICSNKEEAKSLDKQFIVYYKADKDKPLLCFNSEILQKNLEDKTSNIQKESIYDEFDESFKKFYSIKFNRKGYISPEIGQEVAIPKIVKKDFDVKSFIEEIKNELYEIINKKQNTSDIISISKNPQGIVITGEENDNKGEMGFSNNSDISTETNIDSYTEETKSVAESLNISELQETDLSTDDLESLNIQEIQEYSTKSDNLSTNEKTESDGLNTEKNKDTQMITKSDNLSTNENTESDGLNIEKNKDTQMITKSDNLSTNENTESDGLNTEKNKDTQMITKSDNLSTNDKYSDNKKPIRCEKCKKDISSDDKEIIKSIIYKKRKNKYKKVYFHDSKNDNEKKCFDNYAAEDFI